MHSISIYIPLLKQSTHGVDGTATEMGAQQPKDHLTRKKLTAKLLLQCQNSDFHGRLILLMSDDSYMYSIQLCHQGHSQLFNVACLQYYKHIKLTSKLFLLKHSMLRHWQRVKTNILRESAGRELQHTTAFSRSRHSYRYKYIVQEKNDVMITSPLISTHSYDIRLSGFACQTARQPVGNYIIHENLGSTRTQPPTRSHDSLYQSNKYLLVQVRSIVVDKVDEQGEKINRFSEFGHLRHPVQQEWT